MESICEYTDKGKRRFCVTFDKVDSNELAHFIGFMACDGGFSNCKLSYMTVSGTERHIIEGFRDKFCPHMKVNFIGKKSSKLVKAVNDVYGLRFPRAMNETFSKFGVFDYKLNRRVVGIKKEFLHAYVAGVIDGDGFITTEHRKDCRTPRLRWFITHNSEKYLADLQEFVDLVGVPTTLRQHGKNVWRLQAQNTEKNKIFLNDIRQHLKVSKKAHVLNSYLDKYFVPQASDELLEGES